MGIVVSSVTKHYDDFYALNNVSLEIETGELMALLGPSGSGKTTLLRVIAGLDIPDSGTVLVEGEDLGSVAAKDREVGFVFQHYALFGHMTVFENIAFGLRVKPKSERLSDAEINGRVSELLQLVQLDRMGNRFPAQLSGGQRQRVALARTLAIRPRMLLLDEPFGALDAKVRQELRMWLRRLQRELGMTTIFVTHDVEEALEVSDRVAVMHAGQLAQVGTPFEVYHHPKDAFVYQFMGQVNVFHARVDGASVSLGDAQNHDQLMYVRPHLLDVCVTRPDGDCFEAVVEHIYHLGNVVRVSLHRDGQEPVLAEVSFERFTHLGLQIGQSVYITIKSSTLFTPDYTI